MSIRSETKLCVSKVHYTYRNSAPARIGTRRDGTGEAPDVTIEGDVWANCRAVLGGAEELEILPRKASAESETRRRRI